MANVKGVGSAIRSGKASGVVKGPNVFGFNSHDYLGTISLITCPR